jgi:hypothetical protein
MVKHDTYVVTRDGMSELELSAITSDTLPELEGLPNMFAVKKLFVSHS